MFWSVFFSLFGILLAASRIFKNNIQTERRLERRAYIHNRSLFNTPCRPWPGAVSSVPWNTQQQTVILFMFISFLLLNDIGYNIPTTNMLALWYFLSAALYIPQQLQKKTLPPFSSLIFFPCYYWPQPVLPVSWFLLTIFILLNCKQ